MMASERRTAAAVIAELAELRKQQERLTEEAVTVCGNTRRKFGETLTIRQEADLTNFGLGVAIERRMGADEPICLFFSLDEAKSVHGWLTKYVIAGNGGAEEVQGA